MTRNVHRSGNIYGRLGIASDRTELLETADGRPNSRETGQRRIGLRQCNYCLAARPKAIAKCPRCGQVEP